MKGIKKDYETDMTHHKDEITQKVIDRLNL